MALKNAFSGRGKNRVKHSPKTLSAFYQNLMPECLTPTSPICTRENGLGIFLDRYSEKLPPLLKGSCFEVKSHSVQIIRPNKDE